MTWWRRGTQKKQYVYDWPMQTNTVDMLIFIRPVGGPLEILMIKRGAQPWLGAFALPGGHMDEDDADLIDAAYRELEEEVSLTNSQVVLQQCGTFGALGRDPRGRYITTVYVGDLHPSLRYRLKAKSDAADVQWFPWNQLPDKIASDHRMIIEDTVNRFLLGHPLNLGS